MARAQSMTCACLLFALCGGLTSATRPPIVFFQVDEMDGRLVDPRSALSSVVRLPFLDSLTKRGVNFVNAYAESPICVSSRATMWTGRRTDAIRTWSNVRGLMSAVGNASVPDWHCSRQAGYGSDYCVEQGLKQNVTTTISQSIQALGYEEPRLVGKMDIGGNMGGGFHAARHSVAVDLATASSDYQGVKCSQAGQPGCYLPGCNVHSWVRPANISKPAFRPPMEWVSDDMAVPAASDDSIVSSCLEYLATLPRSSSGAHASSAGADPPQVFLYCSIVAPHPPYWTNSTWLKQVNRSAMEAFLPPATPVGEMHPFDVYQSRSEGVLGNETREQRMDLAAAYYGRVAMADAMMGRVMDAVNETFMRDDAFVLFVADHGELALQHSLVEKMSMYEGSGRVPFIVAGPQIDSSKQGTYRTDFVSLLDVFPTLLDAAGAAELPPFLHGASVMPLVRPPSASKEAATSNAPPHWRQFVTSQFHGEESNTGSFMVRWDDSEGDWKGIFFGTSTPSGYEHYTPRLFELQSDPHELHDLADARQDKLLQLETMLLSVYDYQEVDRQAKADQRDAFVRWTQLWPGDQWMTEIAADYIGFEHEDALTIQRWLNETAVL